MSLHLIVIGAGLAGLSAALATKLANPKHTVTILESVKELAEVGAGLQLTPNATRLFKPWGIYDNLSPLATFPGSLCVRRYDGTKILRYEPAFQENINRDYRAPFWGMHRVDLQRAMAARVKELGVTLVLGARVVDVDFEQAIVRFVKRGVQDGAEGEEESITGDVVLGADGLWSATRAKFLGQPSPAKFTGDCAFRIVIKTADLHGPDKVELEDFIRSATVNFWIGPAMHVVAYTMRAAEVYNIVLLCPDDLPADVAKIEGDVGEMRRVFEPWDPLLKKFLAQVQEVAKWRLMWLEALPDWVNSSGTFMMAGDSCHPMLPYLAQGANSSLEDGAVLGHLLGKVQYTRRKEQLPKMASMYQELRKTRGELIAKKTFEQREDFHMVDGDAQKIRDELLQGTRIDQERDFPARWLCPRMQPWLYGYDAYETAEEAFKANPF